MATAIAVGVGVTVLALASRAAIKTFKQTSMLSGISNQKYLRGGFEPQMSTREAMLILGLKEPFKPDLLKKQHRSHMLANHPDRGGSPFLASKINEAKELLDKKRF